VEGKRQGEDLTFVPLPLPCLLRTPCLVPCERLTFGVPGDLNTPPRLAPPSAPPSPGCNHWAHQVPEEQ
jgi:hypothetical protein